MGCHHIREYPHRSVGDASEFELVVPHDPDGLAERRIDLGHQGQAQGVHVGEMPIETGGDDTRGLGYFAQADAAETPATLHELAGGIEQGLACL